MASMAIPQVLKEAAMPQPPGPGHAFRRIWFASSFVMAPTLVPHSIQKSSLQKKMAMPTYVPVNTAEIFRFAMEPINSLMLPISARKVMGLADRHPTAPLQ